MATNSNALLRHITIDSCLRDTQRQYSLTDLIAACTKAVKENSPVKLRDNFCVSTRTVQLDIQFMRDKKRGYGAPIAVYGQKYYKYKDPEYSIGSANVKETNLEPLSEIAETLRRYTSIAGMEPLQGAVRIIKDIIETKVNKGSRKISYQMPENISGANYFDILRDAIVNRKVLSLTCSGNIENVQTQIVFYPVFMKEYLNSWIAIGYEDGKDGCFTVPLETITSYSYAILPFPPNYGFDAEKYFADIIGVTHPDKEKQEITLKVKNSLGPRISANPIHRSQKLLSREDNGDYLYKICIIPNEEFYDLIYRNQPNIQIITPKEFGVQANKTVEEIAALLPDYTEVKIKKEPAKKKKQENSEPDLFAGLF